MSKDYKSDGSLITIGESIKQLECILFGLERGGPVVPHIELEDRILRDRALNKAIDILKDMLKNGWVPCKTRQPNQTKRFNVTWLDRDDCRVYSDTNVYFADEKRWDNENERYTVIAWKNMPEPWNPGDIYHGTEKT